MPKMNQLYRWSTIDLINLSKSNHVMFLPKIKPFDLEGLLKLIVDHQHLIIYLSSSSSPSLLHHFHRHLHQLHQTNSEFYFILHKTIKFHKPQIINPETFNPKIITSFLKKKRHHGNFLNLINFKIKNHTRSFHRRHHNPHRTLLILLPKLTHRCCFKSGFAISSSTKPNPPVIKTKTRLKAFTCKQLSSFNLLKASTFTIFFTQSHNFLS